MSRIATLARPAAGSPNEASELPHILLVLDQFPKVPGGGERIALRLATLLPHYGYRASILTFSSHPESPILNSPPCPLYVLPLERTYDLNAMRAARALSCFLREERVEIVQTFFESSDIWGGLVTKLTSTAKLIWSRRDMGILRSTKHHVAYKLMSGLPDAVFAVSEQVGAHCREVDGIDPEKVQTIYNGLDLADWGSRSNELNSERSVVVTTVGNIRRVKGHDVLLRAAGRIITKFPKVQFAFGGDVLEPEYFAELQRLVVELDLSGNLRFVGGVKDLQTHLASADIFVLPSRSEGFSNAIVEAMAASLPVVATNVGGNAEAVQNGVSGYVVPSEDAGALSDAIERLLADPTRARTMGLAGKALVAQKFTTEAMMRLVTATYADLRAR